MRATDNFFARKRQWSRLKDRILGAYLKPYLAKIARTRRPTLIVDCFAGKGAFDDGEPGSPLIIADAISDAMRSRPDTRARGLFIEKKYHTDLRENLRRFEDCQVLAGTYEEHMAEMDAVIQPQTNVLLFVDPYGIKSLDMARFRHILSLPVNTVELIMNFATFGFLREGCRLKRGEGFDCADDSDVYEDDPDSANTPERMNAIAGGNYWNDILDRYYTEELDMRAAEQAFTNDYMDRVRQLFNHVVSIPVQYRRGQLPKYRLIYGTQSPDGVILMADNMGRVWRDFVAQDRGGQGALFEEIDYPDMANQEGYRLEDDVVSLAGEGIELKTLEVQLIGKYGITFPEKELKRRIKEMEQRGDISVRRDPPRTPKTGRVATSMDYTKYRIWIARANDG